MVTNLTPKDRTSPCTEIHFLKATVANNWIRFKFPLEGGHMIVRGRILGSGEVIQMEITANIPVQRMLTISDLCTHYPKISGRPQSVRTIKRWIKAGYIPVFKLGGQVFANPERLPEKSLL